MEKFSSKRMWWTYENGKLVAEKDISRDPFGTFQIKFRQDLENGAVIVEIKNRDYPSLNRAPVGYESFPAAVEAISTVMAGDFRRRSVATEYGDFCRAYIRTTAFIPHSVNNSLFAGARPRGILCLCGTAITTISETNSVSHRLPNLNT